MKYPAYQKYKESGVVWLGEVPKHWEVKSARLCYSIQLGKMLQPEASNSNDQEVPYLKSQHVQWESVRIDDLPTMWASTLDEVKYGVADGDLLVCEGGDVGRAGIVENPQPRTIIQNALHRVRSNKNDLRFLMFILEHAASQKWFEILCNRSTIAHFTSEKFGALRLPLPEISEQTAIADFLDRETGRVDTLVAKKRRLIELLKEERSVLISRTVTRGLPAEVAREFGVELHTCFKDSGIEWLGEVPKGWEVLPFTKYVAEKSDYRGKTPEKIDSGVFLVTAKNVRMGYIDYETSQEYVAEEDYDEIMRRGLPKIGDILFTTEAPLGNVALVDREDVAMAQRIIRFRMDKKSFDSRYTLYAMMSDHFQNQLKSLSTGSTAEGLKASKLPILKLVCPLLEEQIAIATYLDREITKIDRLVEKVEAVIARLQEYRTALITAAVTGKIDVQEKGE